MSEVVPIRRVPVLTLMAPEYDLEPLGIIAVRGEWDLDFSASVDDMEKKLMARAIEKYPNVTMVCNVVFTRGDGYYGHTWYEATADVYGRLKA